MRSSTSAVRAASGGNPHLAIAACWYWIRKLQARFFAGDYASAIAARGERANALLWTSPSFFEQAEYHLLRRAGAGRALRYGAAAERRQHLEALAAHHRQLQKWAENCPENFAEPRGAGRRRDRPPRRPRARCRAALRSRPSARPARTASSTTRRSPTNSPRASTRRAALRQIAHAVSAGRPRLLSALGRRWQGAATRRSSIRTSATEEPAPAPTSTIGSAGRAAGCRDRGQGVAGGVGRDRPRQAHRDADADRDRACRRRAWPAHPVRGRRATDRGGSDDRRASQVEVTLRETSVSPAELPEIRAPLRDPDAGERDLDDASAQNPFLGRRLISRQQPGRSSACPWSNRPS